MNERALRVLEYPKIIEMLTAMATSAPGKEKARSLEPSASLSEVLQLQEETGDALRRLYAKGSLSFSGVKDLRSEIRRLEIGSSMGCAELMDVAKLLDAAGRVKSYGKTDEEERKERRTVTRENVPGAHWTKNRLSEATETPLEEELNREDTLSPMFQGIEPLPSLSREIRRAILSEEEIADDASPELRRIRRQIANSDERIHSVLQSMVNGSARMYLQDAIITQRDGRYCIPVKAEHRSQVPGMIHDQSASGSTIFVEPMAVVKLNNEIRELRAEENKEITRILAALSSSVAQESENLITDIDLLSELDFIFARASLAKKMDATKPEYNEDGIVDLKKARHPLIERKKVVPVDIRVGRDFDLLVISGPNTGGKTVSLKTVGLLTLMGQSGLHIPAREHSALALFTEVFADIGDEQSIEQSLSTFSSHMTNIVSFWREADENSLVLFDELGAGTDPEEGAALAISILSHLHARGIRTIATTHYSELKIYALSTLGVENACCEFDVSTLRPTYRLLIGVPGKSNAFAISKKLGLPEEIIEDARKHISEEEEDFEDVISDLEDRRVSMEKAEDEMSRTRVEIQRLRDSLARKEKNLDESRQKILDKARDEAAQILREAKQVADETIRTYNKYGGGADGAKMMERQRGALREKMSSLEGQRKKAEEAWRVPGKKVEADKLRVGEPVRVVTMNLDGTVLSLPDSKGNLMVQMGILHSQVNVKDLEYRDEVTIQSPSYQKTGSGKVRMSKSASISAEINLLGKTVDEALPELDKYLDDAALAHLEQVRVVHGKGTGALRKGVHEFLRKNKHVKSYRLGAFGEGDAGVTIVVLR